MGIQKEGGPQPGMQMNRVARLEVIPSGRRVGEVNTTTGEVDWKTGADAQRLVVNKLNQVIVEIEKLQHLALAMSTVLSKLPEQQEGGDGKQPEQPAA